jgi:hypothetical protein
VNRTVLAASLAVLACSSPSGGPAGPPPHEAGDESFVSSPPRSPGALAGDALPTASPPESGGETPQRAVVEADLHVRSGGLVLVQNAWRGLQVVDVSDPAAPSLLGRVPLTGSPVGLYLRGDVVLVASAEHLAWALDAATGVVRSTVGSRLWAVDVANPAAPIVLAELAIPGVLEETRLVGDVLYTVSRTSPGWWVGPGTPVPVGAAAEPAPDATVVSSFDVSAPGTPVPVARIDLPAAGWDTHAHVTSERITLARAGWGEAGPFTLLTAVDISDPGGALAAGAEARIDGLVRDRWALDLDAASGTFRAVVQNGWNAGATLVVLDWAEPSKASPRSKLAIEVPESVTAARFDGSRVYVVTALAVDPLWVVDVSDPSAPALGGHLEMPGQLDFVEPRGDRLLALGHTPEGGGSFQLQVSLLDVADPAAPLLVARRWFGPEVGWVPAAPDDLRKAFQVLDDRGLVLVPYQGFDRGTWRWNGGTQLLAFGRDALELGGFVPHAGAVKRAFPLDAPGLLAAWSDESLQTIDASDPARPVEVAAIDLARPVWDIAVAGSAAVELSGDPWRGATELVVVPASDPEAAVPAARVPLAASSGRLFRVGAVVWVHATDPWTSASFLLAVDVADPAAPALRGRLDLPAPGGGWWDAGAVLAGSALAVQRVRWTCGASCTSEAEILSIDLGDPDAPRLAATIPLPRRSWTSGLAAVGTDVWYSQYEWMDGGAQPYAAVRYHVGRVDLSDPTAPVVHPTFNVPGAFFSASDDGAVVYTEEVYWPWTAAEPRTFLHALAPTGRGTARLVASAELPGFHSGAVRAGAFAYVPGVDPSGSRARLSAVSLEAMSLARTAELDTGWATILGVAGGKLFVSSSWPSRAVLVLGLGDPSAPALERTVPTAGWVDRVVVEGGVAYLPAGPYGVATVGLAP